MHQAPLFPPEDDRDRTESFDVPDASVRLTHGFLEAAEADALLAELLVEVPWNQERILVAGRECRVPRLVAWYGDPDAVYEYSGVRHDPIPWTERLGALRDHIALTLGERFNSALLNLYRDGQDSMGWHSDDEAALGKNPCIASLSLGAQRPFQLKHRTRSGVERLDLALPHGSLLVMAGRCQHAWQHRLPKRTGKNDVGPRVNLTFRWVQPAGEADRAPAPRTGT